MSTVQKDPSPPSTPRDSLSRLRIQRDAPPRPSRIGRFFKRLIWLVVIVLLIGGTLFAALRVGGISVPTDWSSMRDVLGEKPEVRLATLTVETGRSGDAQVVASGYLESRRQAKIGARAAGRIEAVNVEEGDRVQASQVLAVLEHADLDASLAAVQATAVRAEAELAEQEITIARLKRDLERADKLRASSSISESDYDQAKFQAEGSVARRDSLKAALALAKARVQEAEQMRENMFIRAPFDGTVISKDAEVGESILPGGMGEASGRGSAVTIADLDHLEVDCDVKEDFISRITVGQTTEIVVDAVPDRRYEGKVRKIIPMGDRARATIKVKVEITNADARLFPDMSGTVYFLPDPKEDAKPVNDRRVFCSAAAVRETPDGPTVWTIDEGNHVQPVRVTTGVLRDDRVEILSGLQGNERVVIGPTGLESGQPVKLLQ